MRVSLLIGLVTGFVIALTGPSFADDDTPNPLSVKLSLLEGQIVTASFDVKDAFTESFRKRLGGGLLSRAEIRMTLIDAAEIPVAVQLRSCEMRLDIWDDVLLLRIKEADRHRALRLTSVEEALKECGKVEGASITLNEHLEQRRKYRLRVDVALNPVSDELVQSTREFLSNPRGTRPGQSRTFFGAVTRFFGSEKSAGGELFVYLSAPLARPSGATP